MRIQTHLPGISRFLGILILFSTIAADAQILRGAGPVETRRYGSAINEQIVRGDRHMARGEFEQALIAYDLAIMQDPNFAESYMKRALAKLRLGDSRSAQQDRDMAIRLNPYVADFYGYGDPMRKTTVLAFNEDLTSQLRADGNIFQTIGELEAALQTPEGRRDAGLYKYRGNLFVLIGRYREAVEDFSTAIRLNPEYAEAWYNRAIARILEGNRPDACYDFERAAALGYGRGEEKSGYFCAF